MSEQVKVITCPMQATSQQIQYFKYTIDKMHEIAEATYRNLYKQFLQSKDVDSVCLNTLFRERFSTKCVLAKINHMISIAIRQYSGSQYAASWNWKTDGIRKIDSFGWYTEAMSLGTNKYLTVIGTKVYLTIPTNNFISPELKKLSDSIPIEVTDQFNPNYSYLNQSITIHNEGSDWVANLYYA